MKIVCLNLIFDCFFLHEDTSTRSECQQKCAQLKATLPTFNAISSSEHYTKVNDLLQESESNALFSTFTTVIYQNEQFIDEVKDDQDSRFAVNTRMTFILNRTLDAAALVYRPSHEKVTLGLSILGWAFCNFWRNSSISKNLWILTDKIFVDSICRLEPQHFLLSV